MSDTSNSKSKRDIIVDALMELAAERRWEEISIHDVAVRAGISLADFRDHFPSKGAVLAAFSRRIDRAVLDGTTNDLAGEPAKDRLFASSIRSRNCCATATWPSRASCAAACMAIDKNSLLLPSRWLFSRAIM